MLLCTSFVFLSIIEFFIVSLIIKHRKEEEEEQEEEREEETRNVSHISNGKVSAGKDSKSVRILVFFFF